MKIKERTSTAGQNLAQRVQQRMSIGIPDIN
jgi:hypothetical protein